MTGVCPAPQSPLRCLRPHNLTHIPLCSVFGRDPEATEQASCLRSWYDAILSDICCQISLPDQIRSPLCCLCLCCGVEAAVAAVGDAVVGSLCVLGGSACCEVPFGVGLPCICFPCAARQVSESLVHPCTQLGSRT